MAAALQRLRPLAFDVVKVQLSNGYTASGTLGDGL
jgi:hypothetical protein